MNRITPLIAATTLVLERPLGAADHASIHTDDAAGCIRGASAGQKGRDGGKLRGIAIAPCGNCHARLPFHLFDADAFVFRAPLIEFGDPVGRYASGGEAVHRDALACHFTRESLCPTDQCRAKSV